MADSSSNLEKKAPFAGELTLRDVQESDLDVFFANQLDPLACQMAAFTAKEPANRAAFDAFWARIRANPGVRIQTILAAGQVTGSVLRYEDEGHPEVSYWISRQYWGQGIATRALAEFLTGEAERPVYARTAADNTGSRRVLEKCGFKVCGAERGFANARGQEIDELLLRLD